MRYRPLVSLREPGHAPRWGTIPAGASMSPEVRQSTNGRETPVYARDAAMLVAVAALFRLPALVTDFWFDEILSYERLAERAHSIGDIFFAGALKHDNNHHINSLTLYLLGEQPHWVAYRLPSLVAGLIAVAMVVLIGRRRCRLDGLVTGVFVAASSMVVLYSTEARGYAWLLLFAATGFLALDRFLTTRGRAPLWAFWLSMSAGLAAHPAILHFYLGALLWSGFRLRATLLDLARLHAVPIVWIGAWIAFVTRGSVVGGGPPWTWREILDGSLAWTLGYPIHTVPPLVVAAACAALVLWDARRLWAEGSDEGFFFVGTILGPVILMTALSPPYLFPRYFLVPLFFLLVVAGRRTAALAASSTRGRWAAAAVVVLFVGGNTVHVTTMFRERYRNHSSAVRLLTNSAPEGEVTVTSWSLDQWTQLPLAFYASRLGLGDRIEYIPRAELSGRVATAPRIDWVTEVTPPCNAAPPARRSLPPVLGTYVLTASFPVCGPSGMSWYVYSRSGP